MSGGGPPLVLERLDLKAFVRQLVEEAVPELNLAGMTYTVHDQTNETLWIEAAPYELVRAYENLITNAIRYGKSGKSWRSLLPAKRTRRWCGSATSGT
ncbi:hypothetical protein VQ056_24995 [Paenibacillus sp. JTLBN-2024]